MSLITTADTIEEWVELAHAEGLTDGLAGVSPHPGRS